ncbi:MAG: TetR/AcrR family transcriptional regulator [Verrucomicrobiales bacterium]|nr:TetR/AcrR family transcriptional regulator [Verrucomicrobiales bacterium]
MDRVIAAADELFRARGFSAVHMDDIAREAGMSKKTLYLHVRSKEELLQVLSERMHGEFERHKQEVLHCRKLSLEERLRLHTEFCRAKLNRLHPAFFLEVKRHAPRVYARMMELRNEGVTRMISALLAQGQREGVVRKDLSMRLAIESFRTLVLNVLQPEVLAAMDLTPAQASREIMELFFSGILIRERKSRK